jgi:hypothetical protein
LYEVICASFFGVPHAKVIDYEGKHDIACYVSEKARDVGALDVLVAVSAEVPDETGLA